MSEWAANELKAQLKTATEGRTEAQGKLAQAERLFQDQREELEKLKREYNVFPGHTIASGYSPLKGDPPDERLEPQAPVARRGQLPH